MADPTAVTAASPLRTALKKKIDEIVGLEQTYDRQRCDTFYTSASMLLTRLLDSQSPELTQFRRLDGRSQALSPFDEVNESRDREAYSRDLKTARSILTAVDESLDWQTSAGGADGAGGVKGNDPDDVNQAVLDFVYDLMMQNPYRHIGWGKENYRTA